ncbi:MAG: filamentous hemagglutinin N-terminal domain-containing protein [Leptolyngbya sp. BL-A-14]
MPDNTLPMNSQVSPGNCGAACTVINGGTLRGANLFHSFRQFSIPTSGEAYFNNAAQIQNILTRVTGGSLSNIDGLIRANGIANLYLVNPNGIVFGPNASLNIGGSFVATTAGGLKLPDGSEYSALNPQAPPLLAVNLAPGVQYSARPPGSKVSNAGNLAVPTRQSITLLGGTTTSTGTLTAPGGTVQVLGDQVALQKNARVDVSSPTGGGTVLIGGDYKGQGTIPNSQSTEVGQNVVIKADALTNGNGGKVILWSDGNTRFGGTITAQGGIQGGNGGFVETSGKLNLTVGDTATVNTFAALGQTGNWLLDPANLTIVGNGTGTGTISPDGTNSPADSTIDNTTIGTALQTTNVILSATDLIQANNVFVTPKVQGGIIQTYKGTDGETYISPVDSQFDLTLSSPTITFTNSTIVQNGGGNILINTGSLTMSNAAISTGVESGAIGLAGSISINARDQVLIKNNSTISSTGNFGQILIGSESSYNSSKDGSLLSKITSSPIGSFILDNSRITTDSNNSNTAGGISINARDQVLIKNNSTISSTGNFGQILIGSESSYNSSKDGSLLSKITSSPIGSFVLDNSRITTDSNNSNTAGNISINARDQVLIKNNSTISSTGNFGQILIGSESSYNSSKDGSLLSKITSSPIGSFVLDNSRITTDSNNSNTAGNISINARDQVLIKNNSTISSTGNFGQILIGGESSYNSSKEGSLLSKITSSPISSFVLDNSRITTDFSNTDSNNNDAAGNISINARDQVLIKNNSTISSTGNFGQILIGSESSYNSSKDGSLLSKITSSPIGSFVLDNSRITTDSNNSNTAGNISINARDQVLIKNNSTISSTGNFGQILIGGESSYNSNKNTFNFTSSPVGSFVLEGSTVSTTNLGNGVAGNIILAADSRILATKSTISSDARGANTISAGSIKVNAESLFLTDSEISVNSEGTGSGGNINIMVPSRITLDHSRLTAETTSTADGGNITIDPDILLLRRDSEIATSAGTAGAGGNGGNITITAGFVVGVLSGNSDIVANAFTGSGGRITINANSIFGFLPAPQGILDTRFSDIAASSQFGFSGTIILNTLNVDPSQGLGELNLIPVDSSNLVAKSCATGQRQALNENRFTETGRSGIPVSPEDVFRNASVLTELGTPATTEVSTSRSNIPAATSSSPRAIVEAQGLVIDPNGKAHLVAQASNGTPTPLQQPRITCPNDANLLRP